MLSKMKIALLIDAENYLEPMSMFGQFCNSLDNMGVVKRKIAFGGWNYNKKLNEWKDVCKIENIQMEGLQGFKGKNAADKSLILTATHLIQKQHVDTLAIYSRDSGFSLVFPVWKSLGTKIIVPRYKNEFIPDADQYVLTTKINLHSMSSKTAFGSVLLSALSSNVSKAI